MKNWTLEYSRGATLVRNADNTYQFDFPGGDGVHYVTREYRREKPNGFKLEATITKLLNDPVFRSVDGGPAALRMYLTNGDMGSENGRWWSNPAKLDLKLGFQVLEVKLDGGWSNVNGKSSAERPREFADCCNHLYRCGFTFGGKFFGHGVYATGGKAQFKFKHKVLL